MYMTNQRTKIKLLSALGCLLIGSSIYLFARSRDHLGFALLDAVGLAHMTDMLRLPMRDIPIPYFVRFCLPDGLWVTSYILFSDHINRHCMKMTRLAWASVVPILGIASEVLQLTQCIPGTFDILDLACYTIPLCLYIVLQKQYRHRILYTTNNN